jgi:Tfp pilus assembly protein PilO
MLIVGSRKNKTLAKRLLLLFIGSLADAIPVISFFPIETAVVVIAYFMILKERREEAEERKKQAEQEQIEMQQIYAQVQSN